MASLLRSIACYLPEGVTDCLDLARTNPDWDIGKTLEKTGVRLLHHARRDESTLDMAQAAAERVLAARGQEQEPDTIILCTQTPDMLLPQGASLLQSRLGLPNSVKCLDISHGCSGYVYGLATAHAYIRAGLSQSVLLVTADNYSKVIDPADKKTFLLFSDGASATLVGQADSPVLFHFGNDGAKGDKIVCRNSGIGPVTGAAAAELQPPRFEMDGYAVFLFTLGRVPSEINAFLQAAGLGLQDIDLFVLHQASRFVLESIRDKMGIPPERLVIDLEEVGNTTSSSIPIALKRAEESGRLRRGQRVLLFGFGIGLSWGGVLLTY